MRWQHRQYNDDLLVTIHRIFRPELVPSLSQTSTMAAAAAPASERPARPSLSRGQTMSTILKVLSPTKCIQTEAHETDHLALIVSAILVHFHLHQHGQPPLLQAALYAS
eukprot:4715397-Pleurochrysis_carterae.AAC.3